MRRLLAVIVVLSASCASAATEPALVSATSADVSEIERPVSDTRAEEQVDDPAADLPVTEEPTSDTTADVPDTATDDLFPDVVGVTANETGEGVWTFNVTLSSPYDSPERYADAWRIVGPDGVVYGERILGHDHANEQPFTRSQSGIVIPAAVTVVTAEGRDQQSGWGGATINYELPR